MIHKAFGVLLMGCGIALVSGTVFSTGIALTTVGSCLVIGLIFAGLGLIII